MKKFFLTLMLVAALFIAPVAAMADFSVTFTWTPNPVGDLEGYRIYDSPTSGDQVMNNPVLAVAIIPAGTETKTIQAADGPHHYVIVAYDTSGNEATEKSVEASVVLDSVPPGATTGFQITVIIKFEGPLPQ